MSPAALAVAAVLAASCSAEPERPPAEVAEAPAPAAEGSLLAQPLSASNLEPRFVTLGDAGAVEEVAVVFSRPVVATAVVGEDADDLVDLRWDPEVPGTVRFTDAATLVFRPAAPFAEGSDFTLALERVDTTSGPLVEPADGAWSHSFSTPEVRFHRARLSSWDPDRRTAEVELVFSGARDPRQVARAVRFNAVDERGRDRGRPRVRLLSEDATAAVAFRLSGEPVVGGRTVRVALEGEGGLADGATVELPGSEALEIKSVHLVEGPTGFRVEVVCDDTAAEGRRWYWDQNQAQSFQISTRCELDPASLDKVLVDPALTTDIAASGGGFQIRGDFERGAYRVRIEAGARGIDGGTLRHTVERDLTVPARSPQLAFTGSGRYLARDAWDSVPLRHLNLASARLEVRHVPVENLAFWLGSGTEVTDERTSRLLASTTLSFDGDLDRFVTTPLDLASMVPDGTRGLLQVSVQSADASARARLLLTDLALVAKRTGLPPPGSRDQRDWGSGVAAWVLDSSSLEGRGGVDLRLLRRNGQVLGSCETDRSGGCVIDLERGLDPSPPFLLVADDGDDFSYIAFDELRSEIQEARVAGTSYGDDDKAAAYSAALFTDRGVYRPGETAHLAAVLRERSGEPSPPDLPVVLELRDPQGKLFRERTLATNEAGFLTEDLTFADYAGTGRYEAVLEVADRVVARERFLVEEFVPERLEVQVTPRTRDLLASDAPAASVDARYLFGGVPAGAAVELACELQPTTFQPEENASHAFGPWLGDEDRARPLQLGSVTAELDDAGQVLMECPRSAEAGRLRGTARAVLRAGVQEAGSGRATVGRAEVRLHPAEHYLGLASGATQIAVGDRVEVEGVVVAWDGRRADAVDRVTLELVRLEREWGAFWDEELGRQVYRSYRRPVVAAEQTVDVADGRFEGGFEVDRSASGFLVRAVAGDALTELYVDGADRYYAWMPQESQRDLTPRPGPPSWLSLETPEEIRVGETVEVSFEAPFTGRALLTLESDEVLASEWIDVDAGRHTWEVRLRARDLRRHHDGGHLPNVYASVFVVKDPHLESVETYLPDRALGVSVLDVVPERIARDPRLEVPGEVRSNSLLRVTLDLGPVESGDGPRYAVVAAVDEGVLSLTDFPTPDPVAELFPRRGLGVETFETVGWTQAQVDDPASATGGDQAGGLAGRVQPVRPVALWSGLREIPDDGRLEVDFAVPEYRGALRVMAVAAGRTTVGHADATVLVRDPLVLQTTLPRFLVQGDEVSVPVQVTNLSGAPQDVEVRLEVESLSTGTQETGSAPVALLGDAEARLSLDRDASDVAHFRLRSNASSGAVALRVVAGAGDLTSEETVQAPLVPRGARVRRTERLVVGPEDAATVSLEDLLTGWEPGSETSTVRLAANRFADVYEHLGYLVRYPYGCLEQTTSTSRPLLSLRDVAPLLTRGGDEEDIDQSDVDRMVQGGIERILSMQTPEGGFAYWPGGDRPAYWASAYALDFLLDARDQRFEVPEQRLEQALSWMEREVAGGAERRRDGYSDDGTAFMHWVLARAGRGQQGLVRRSLERLEREASQGRPVEEGGRSDGALREDRFLLQAALHLTGDHRFEDRLRTPEVRADETPERSYGWSFYSDRRRRGLMLSVAVDLFGNQGAGTGSSPLEPLALAVSEELRGESRRYTTQELVWGLTGLSKYSAGGGTEALTEAPELWVGGALWQPEASQAEGGTWTWAVPRASERRSLELRMPSPRTSPLYLQVSSFGVRSGTDQPGPGGSGVDLTRRFRRADGTLFDPSAQTVALGEVIAVELEVANRSGVRITNLALTDRVAAGLEIENPRFARSLDASAAGWVDRSRLWSPDHLEVRDDRLQIFGTLEPNQEALFVYQLRAVAAGSFTAPMPAAEAMYNPQVWARAAAVAFRVRSGR